MNRSGCIATGIVLLKAEAPSILCAVHNQVDGKRLPMTHLGKLGTLRVFALRAEKLKIASARGRTEAVATPGNALSRFVWVKICNIPG